MPLYEYECEKCGKKFEKIQSFSEPPIEKCEFCSGSVRKVLSPPAIIFKGTGWYVTDYARKNSGNGKKNGKGKEASKPEEKTSTKTD